MSNHGMVMNALACAQCGAGLPPPDGRGASWCVYCGTEYRCDRARSMFEQQEESLLTTSERHSLSIGRESWHDGEDAARIPMTEDAVLHLVREHFDTSESVFVCPHIPARKEIAARRAHVVHLSPRERILALYDASISHKSVPGSLPPRLGMGDEGFIVTSRRLCWKNVGEPACSIEWRDFDPDLLYVGSGQLFVGNDGISLNDEALVDACANAFHVLALSGLPPRPLASGPVPRDTSPDATPTPFMSPLTAPHQPEPPPQYRHQTDFDSVRAPVATVATPPPAHTTSYLAYASHAEANGPDCACWHCKTPLHSKTPQCSFCGAKPKKKGWLRAS